MTRDATLYGAGGKVREGFAGFDPDVPIAGHYKMRLRSGGAYVGVRIWYGAPHDPWTGEEMDRSWRWQAHINGEYSDLDRVWPKCAGSAITEGEYTFLTNLQSWAKEHAPGSGLDDPRKKIDLLNSPLPF